MQAQFTPLVCPTCSSDLSGRAADLVACCLPCRHVFRVDGELLVQLSTITVEPVGDRYLPFWASGGAAVPAFLSSRPLALARLVSRALDHWRGSAEGPSRPTLGAAIPPESFPRLARLAGLESAPGAVSLLAVPIRIERSRLLLPDLEVALYREDLVDADDLLR